MFDGLEEPELSPEAAADAPPAASDGCCACCVVGSGAAAAAFSCFLDFFLCLCFLSFLCLCFFSFFSFFLFLCLWCSDDVDGPASAPAWLPEADEEAAAAAEDDEDAGATGASTFSGRR